MIYYLSFLAVVVVWWHCPGCLGQHVCRWMIMRCCHPFPNAPQPLVCVEAHSPVHDSHTSHCLFSIPVTGARRPGRCVALHAAPHVRPCVRGAGGAGHTAQLIGRSHPEPFSSWTVHILSRPESGPIISWRPLEVWAVLLWEAPTVPSGMQNDVCTFAVGEKLGHCFHLRT